VGCRIDCAPAHYHPALIIAPMSTMDWSGQYPSIGIDVRHSGTDTGDGYDRGHTRSTRAGHTRTNRSAPHQKSLGSALLHLECLRAEAARYCRDFIHLRIAVTYSMAMQDWCPSSLEAPGTGPSRRGRSEVEDVTTCHPCCFRASARPDRP
jgi:hypothetical protein